MDQFRCLFGSSRQPCTNTDDEIHVYPDSSHGAYDKRCADVGTHMHQSSYHCHFPSTFLEYQVVVLCKNQFYYFPALWPETGHVAVDEADILDILRAIQKHASQLPEEETSRNAIGVFSSLPRSEWATARAEMIAANADNANALHIIDSALFLLVLDDYTPLDIDDAAANMLHGTNRLGDDGQQIGSCLNRWYDKLQLIVCKDATCGVNFEHSTLDGHTALRFVSDIFAETVISFAESIVDLIHGRGRIQHIVEATIQRASVCKSDTLDVLPRKLVFDLSESVLERIYFAETNLCDEVVANDSCVLEFTDYGKLTIVSNNMSPDSFVQMSIILAYYKLYGRIVCAYEPVLTKVRLFTGVELVLLFYSTPNF
jgi:carnitine O-acetyltransferase